MGFVRYVIRTRAQEWRRHWWISDLHSEIQNGVIKLRKGITMHLPRQGSYRFYPLAATSRDSFGPNQAYLAKRAPNDFSLPG